MTDYFAAHSLSEATTMIACNDEMSASAGVNKIALFGAMLAQ